MEFFAILVSNKNIFYRFGVFFVCVSLLLIVLFKKG